MSIVFITGWAQAPEFLTKCTKCVDPITYGNWQEMQDVLQKIGECELLIGWSLGGQIALRGIQEGVIKAKKLVLISAPYQFKVTDGYKESRALFDSKPDEMLKGFFQFVSYGDSEQKKILREKQVYRYQEKLKQNYLYWLDQLEAFNGKDIAVQNIPSTLLIYGDKDAIAPEEDGRKFVQTLPDATIIVYEGCAHAPHWHDTARVEKDIREFLA